MAEAAEVMIVVVVEIAAAVVTANVKDMATVTVAEAVVEAVVVVALAHKPSL